MDRSGSQNIFGMAELLEPDGNGTDLEELEEAVMKGTELIQKAKVKDFVKEYERDINQASRDFDFNKNDNMGSFLSKKPNFGGGDRDSREGRGGSGSGGYGSNNASDKIWGHNMSQEDEAFDEEMGQPMGGGSHGGNGGNGGNGGPRNRFRSNDDDDVRSVRSLRGTASSARPVPRMHSDWSNENPKDPYLATLTEEERKQTHINNVIGSMTENEEDGASEIIKQEEEEEMANIIEKCDMLRSNLENEGVDVHRIAEVTTETSKKEAKAILRILQIKHDRLRYCDIFEEGLLAVAYSLEELFDGKREWFGRRPDLVGWSDTVKVKLRRLRPDTSALVSDIMKDYNINSGWRIAMELLPSIFLYSRHRKIKAHDNLRSDEMYKDAVNIMQSTNTDAAS